MMKAEITPNRVRESRGDQLSDRSYHMAEVIALIETTPTQRRLRKLLGKGSPSERRQEESLPHRAAPLT